MTDYYVDSAASGANDGSSPTDAWQTFAAISWGGIGANDTLNVTGVFTEQLIVGASGTAGNPLTINGAYSGKLSEINAVGFAKGVSLSGDDYVTVKGFYVYDCELTGEGIGFSIQGCTGTIVEGCYASNSYYDDFKIDISENCHIRKCTSVKSQRRAFTISAAGTGGAYTEVDNCTITDCVSFQSSAVGTTFRAFTLSGGSASKLVKNSGFDRCFGYRSNVEGLHLNYYENCYFKNGIIDNRGGSGVAVDFTQSGDGFLLENTQIRSAAPLAVEFVGLSVTSANVTIRNCSLDSDSDVIQVNAGHTTTNLTLDNCTIKSTGGNGIDLVASAVNTDMTIKNCEIRGGEGASDYGLSVASTADVQGLKISNCYFYNSWAHIRYAGVWGNDSYIRNCTFGPTTSAGGETAIRAQEAVTATVAIEGNVFDGLDDHCVWQNSSYNQGWTFNGNYFYSINQDVLVLTGSPAVSYTADGATGTNINVLDAGVITDKRLAVGYQAISLGGTGTNQIISNNIIS